MVVFVKKTSSDTLSCFSIRFLSVCLFVGCAILFRFRAPPHVRRDGVSPTQRDASTPEPNPDRTRDDAARRTAQARIGDRKSSDHSLVQHRERHAHGATVYRLQSGRSDSFWMTCIFFNQLFGEQNVRNGVVCYKFLLPKYPYSNNLKKRFSKSKSILFFIYTKTVNLSEHIVYVVDVKCWIWCSWRFFGWWGCCSCFCCC